MPGKNNAAAVWPNESDDHVKARRLARAIRAEQANDFAAAHVDVDPVNDRAAAVNFHELIGRENISFATDFCVDATGEAAGSVPLVIF